MKMIAVTPYSARESLGWVVRNLAGLSRRNAGAVEALSSPHVFNGNVTRRYTVAAIGDIMPMRGGRLGIDGRLKEFFGDCDFLIGNFEGTITAKRPAIWPIAFDQRHDAAITEDLAAIFRPGRTYLSVSNNHAGDFGEEEFLKSAGVLKSAGFNVFGWSDNPHTDINGDLRVAAGTMWSNRAFNAVAHVKEAGRYARPGAFNIYCPHMGYELELYPRPEIAALAGDIAGPFDAVIASHPHCPQPVTARGAGGPRKMVAYSLGDFCCSLRLKTMQYGLAVKLEIGRDSAGRWAAGRAEWLYTECVPSGRGHFTVRPLAQGANQFTNVRQAR